ncbi:hypothetical protein AB0870_18360 (plasmid) [Microbacterium proteolyticum]|uniref:hypothetical protein n=1 Tax=Microbacterium TaxID=33882 RepID=UPI00136AF7F0|nr:MULTISPECIES: hypothetical protein [Microbacterium]MXS75466.1 hypothetical protein [Microbacterium sp. TL13]
MTQSIERVQLTVNGATHALAPLESVGDIEAQVLGATRAGGGFITVTLDGGERLSIFVSAAASSITIASSTVRLDSGLADGGGGGWRNHSGQVFDDEESPYDII